MADDSTQKWLGRNRPPRVQITYDLETRGAIEKRELPLVVGILADLAGQGDETVADFKNRKFIEIDRDNFNDVMRSISPTLKVAIAGKNEDIIFQTVDDFTPDRLVEKVSALKKVLFIRQRVNDLVGKLDGKPNQKAILAKEQVDIATLLVSEQVAAMATQADITAKSIAAVQSALTDKELPKTAVTNATQLDKLAKAAKAATDAAKADPLITPIVELKKKMDDASGKTDAAAAAAATALTSVQAIDAAADDEAAKKTAVTTALTDVKDAKDKADVAAQAAKDAADAAAKLAPAGGKA